MDYTITEENKMMFFILYTIVGMVGTVSNVLVLQTFWRERKKSLFHIQLALVNIFSLSIIIFIGPAALRGRFFFGKSVCQYSGFHAFLFGFAEINFTCLVCFECLVAIWKKSEYSRLMSNKVQTVLSVASWLYALVFAAAPLYGWGRYTFEPDSTSCGIDLHTEDPDGSRYLLVATAIFGVLIGGAALAVGVALWKQKHLYSNTFEPLISDTELIKISAALLIILSVCSLPFFARVLQFIRGFDQPFSSFLTIEFSHLSMKISCCLHPISYFFYSEQFKKRAVYRVTGIDPEKKNH